MLESVQAQSIQQLKRYMGSYYADHLHCPMPGKHKNYWFSPHTGTGIVPLAVMDGCQPLKLKNPHLNYLFPQLGIIPRTFRTYLVTVTQVMSDSSSFFHSGSFKHLLPREDYVVEKQNNSEVLNVPFGRASQLVKRNSGTPYEINNLNPQLELGNESPPALCDSDENSHGQENICGATKSGMRDSLMTWTTVGTRSYSVAQLPHPSRLRRKKQQYYGKLKPLGWDFMSHVQQLHRKKEEFESMPRSEMNPEGFIAEKNPMYVRVVRNQEEILSDRKETALFDSFHQVPQDHSSNIPATFSPPRMKERSFNLFSCSEE